MKYIKKGYNPISAKNSPFKKGHKLNLGRKISEATRHKMITSHESQNPSYFAVHTWLRRKHKEKKIKCNHCGSRQFLDWALKKGMKHSRLIENYLILCRSCHKKYDYTDKWRLKISKSLIGNKYSKNNERNKKGQFIHK